MNTNTDLTIVIDVEDKFTHAMHKIETKARDTKKELDQSMLFKLKADVAGLDIQLKEARAKLRKATTKAEKLKLTLDTQDLQRNLTEAKRKLNNYLNTGDVNVSRLQAKFDSLGNSIKDIFSGGGLNALDEFLGKLPKIGGHLQAILWFVVGLGNALLKAGKNAQEFEDAFAGVRKTLDDTEKNLQTIEKGIINLSTKIPISVKELGGIAESAGQLGVASEDILKFTDTVAKIGVSTNLTAEDAAMSLAQIADSLQEPLHNIDRIGSTIVALGNNFATTESKIVDFANRIKSAGGNIGLTTDQIFAIATAFSATGTEAEAGGTAVQKVVHSINNAVNSGSEKLQVYARIAEQSAEDFKKSWKNNAGQGFLSFVEGLQKSGQDANRILEEMGLKDTRLTSAFLSLANAGDILNNALNTANKAREENNALQEEAEKRFQTTTSQIQIQDNKRKAFSASIGAYWNKIWLPVYKGVTTYFLELLPRAFQVFQTALHNTKKALSNMPSFILGAFKTLPSAVGTILNSVLSAVEKYINQKITTINKYIQKVKKIPGVSSLIGDTHLGSITLGRINVAPVNLPSLGELTKGFAPLESFSAYTNKTYEIADGKAKEKIKKDIQADLTMLSDIQDILDKKKGGSAKSRTKELAQELEKQKALEIKAVQESEATEEEKFQKLQAIKEKYDKKKLELEKKTDDALLKQAEQYMKKMEKNRADTVKDHQKMGEQAMKDVEKYKEKLTSVKEKFDEIKTKATETIREIQHEMKTIDAKHIDQLGARYYEVTKQIRDAERESRELKSYAQSHTLQELQEMEEQGYSMVGGVDIEKLIQHVKLKEELLLLEQQVSQEQREQAKINANKNETSKLLEQYQKEKQALEEKQAIIKAITATELDREAKLKLEGDQVAYWDEEKKQRSEIVDHKNAEYARDLLNQQQKLNSEYEANQQHLKKSQLLVVSNSRAILNIRKQETLSYQYELEERTEATRTYVNNIKAMMSELAQARKLANSNSVVNNNNQVTNSNNRTTNHNYTIVHHGSKRPLPLVGVK